MAKKGRKRDNYTTTWGETIDGLGQLADGRWVDLDDRPHPWTSPDERAAIKEFRKRRARRGNDHVAIQVVKSSSLDVATVRKALEQSEELAPLVTIDFTDRTLKLEMLPPSHPFWEAVGELIRSHPKVAAQNTNIKELEWLEDLEPPPVALALTEVGEIYKKKQFKHKNEAVMSQMVWQEFREGVAPATTIKGTKPEHLQNYHQNTLNLGLESKTVRNRYAKIGSMLKYAHDRSPAHRAQIQSLMTDFRLICKAPRKQEGAPNPIDPDDFAALYDAADLRWRAILLCMLNFAMHPRETGDILKKEIDLKLLQFMTRRTRSGVLRVATIWEETADAITAFLKTQKENAMYQANPRLFLTVFDLPYSYGGLTQYFRETLKPRAEKMSNRTLKCTLDSIRDGAQNAADDGGADSIHTEMLMGHALPGAMGHYKKRTPKKTSISVECIHSHYQIDALVAGQYKIEVRRDRLTG